MNVHVIADYVVLSEKGDLVTKHDSLVLTNCDSFAEAVERYVYSSRSVRITLEVFD